MKRMLMAAALALAAGGQALAADLPQAPPPPPPRAPAAYIPAPPVYNWGGVYVGVNGGYGFGNSTWSNAFGSTGSFSTNGGFAGGTLGANFQASQFVFGVEGDVDWTDLKGTSSSLVCTSYCQTANNWLGTLRGRLGFAADRILFYGTGGAAFGDVKATTPFASNSSTEVGWTAGAGVEFALSQNWTAKAEYLYVDLSKGSCTTACGSPASTVGVSFTESLVRAGVNYKFNF